MHIMFRPKQGPVGRWVSEQHRPLVSQAATGWPSHFEAAGSILNSFGLNKFRIFRWRAVKSIDICKYAHSIWQTDD